MYIKKAIVLLLMFGCVSSCSKYPREVQQALNLSGNNSKELEKVIDHYSANPADSLKLKSAYFLISNMRGKYFFQGDLLDHYYELIANIDSKELLDSIQKKHGPFSYDHLEVKYDLRELKAPFLINNIDMAFKVWHEQPWGRDINFMQFCEYILPYRVDNEIPNYNRAEIYAKYNTVLDSIRNKNGDALQACFTLNNVLMKEGWRFSINAAFLPSFPAKKLLNQKSGNCRDMAAKTIFIMRALGIPIAGEFTPHWANRPGRHNWNVVLDKNGINHSFMGIENNNTPQFVSSEEVFAKTFINTYARQNYCSDLVEDDKNDIPLFFQNKFIKDVTGENIGSKDICIELNESKYQNFKYVYLCVFDNANWVPIDWAAINKNQALFKNIMPGITYLPAYFKNGVIIPASYPVTVTKSGNLKHLIPSKSVFKTLTLKRKYPMLMKAGYAERMKGGRFQASDRPNFDNTITLYTIPYPKMEMKWYDVPIKLKRPYKYFRYLSPDGSYGNIAELNFYSHGVKLKGKIIGSEGSFENKPIGTFPSAMDGDNATFFDYKKPDDGWVGLKCSNPLKIDLIRFLPRNDDNGIVEGQQYELFYWENSKWISMGKKIATDTQLTYKNIPSNALYLLRNLTKGIEERIFTYENNKQIWW